LFTTKAKHSPTLKCMLVSNHTNGNDSNFELQIFLIYINSVLDFDLRQLDSVLQTP